MLPFSPSLVVVLTLSSAAVAAVLVGRWRPRRRDASAVRIREEAS